MQHLNGTTIDRAGSGHTHFDRTVAVTRLGERHFGADLDDSWSSLWGIHGGYSAALGVRAAEAQVPERAVRTATTSFLRPAATGPAMIELRELRHGRTLTTLEATVLQHDRATSVTRVTLAVPTTSPGWSPAHVDGPPPLAECIPFTPPPSIRHFAQAELRIDPNTLPGDGVDDARIAGHVRPIEPRPFDAAWLVMIGDWFPPAAFRRLSPPQGGISIDYTVHLHRQLPADPERWLRGVFDATTDHAGIALEHGLLTTDDGTPVAETFHSRWTA